MTEFPTPEAGRAACVVAGVSPKGFGSYGERIAAAVLAVDESLIRADERAKVLSEVVALLRSVNLRDTLTWQEALDYIERMAKEGKLS